MKKVEDEQNLSQEKFNNQWLKLENYLNETLQHIQEKFQNQIKDIRGKVENINSDYTQGKTKIDAQIIDVKNNFSLQLQHLSNEIENMKTSIEKYQKLDNLQSNFSELSNRVNETDEKMNNYVKNIILIKKLSVGLSALQEKVNQLEQYKLRWLQ